MNRLTASIQRRPEALFYLAAAFLGVSYLLIVAIDVFNAFDLHTRWIGAKGRWYLWLHWFEVPVETPLQWACLGAVAVLFFLSAGAIYQREQGEAFDFAMLFGIGATLMLVEDSLNPRHYLRFYLEGRDVGGYTTVGTLAELAYFALLGGLLVFVFLRFRRVFWKFDKVKTYLIRGYVLYAVAVGSSWMGSAFRSATDTLPDLYTVVGRFATGILFFDEGPRQAYFEHIDDAVVNSGNPPLAFWFMDRVWEESLELLGASALLVAAVAFFVRVTDDPDDTETG